MTSEPSFTLGIEEEYLLVDLQSRDLARDPPAGMLEECEARLTGQVSPEFLKSQIEVATRKSVSVKEARADLVHLRRTVAEVAERHGMAPIAASTHPFARWTDQKHTDRARYDIIARDMAAVARRLVICGLHVHVGIDDDDLRIDLMNQASYFLPHLLALSTSSPFWQGEETGLMSFRLSVFDSMPRTGLPDRFESYGEYQRLVERMVGAGLIEDASKLWWDLRPSARFPTLELRIPDVCTRLDDTITIAALYLCLLSMLHRLKQQNQRWRIYALPLIRENRWLAQRYGLDRDLVDFGKGHRVPYADLLEELFALVRVDAERLDCVAEIEHAREIVRRGTSAHGQLAAWRAALEAGKSREAALGEVVDWLVRETRAGLD
ncbi:MAG: carboxylate-amine ligase [Alphaproteobacteria bacterium]|nr:carboxylate-amine ligase [Alphaproteobacteria bacterium]